jgi:glycine cleavage system H protein
VSGEVVEVNAPLKEHPEAVNKNPHDAWMLKVRISNPGDAAGLLDSAQYQGLLG